MKLQASMTVEAAGVMVVVLTTLMILMGLERQSSGKFCAA